MPDKEWLATWAKARIGNRVNKSKEEEKMTKVYALEFSRKVNTSNRFTGHALYSYLDPETADEQIRKWAPNPWCTVKSIEILNEVTGDVLRVTQREVEIEGNPSEMNQATYYKRVRRALKAEGAR